MESVKDNGGWIKAVIWCDSSVLLNCLIPGEQMKQPAVTPKELL